jgi:aconitate hydratase
MTSPYASCLQSVKVDGRDLKFYDLGKIGGSQRYAKLPFSIRVLLESAVRNCDGFQVCQTRKFARII